ncbi:glycosyltransferase family 8 protein [Pedobacter yulinensis]|uniref:Glycosyltransferase family 8 protein n=1 Tax=Pedobacter yulinensis TaxID=2126353 RepID=A0A2T3HLR1_9SPHI|nr:glycosyltransferase family 8 protein [Pedobacter yulinensis]PST83377.1 glycosyltransferase family 8 protein [Pedobacter yulinensis]
MATTITLVSICDNHYAEMLCALLKSIAENHHTGEPISYYIIDDQISTGRKKQVEQSVAAPDFTLNWIPLKKAIPANARVPIDLTMYPLNIYARLFISETLPGLERVIYLDVDTIVNGEISELWNTDLQGRIAGAVLDPLGTFDNPAGVGNYRELGLSGKSPYFNSGVLLLDLKAWKARNLGEEVLRIIYENRRFAKFPDQYGLNVALADNWTPIDPSWNAFASFEYQQLPNLVHFIAQKPIYEDYQGNVQFRDLFYGYLGRTAFRGFRPAARSNRFMQKGTQKLKKFFFKLFGRN